MQLHDKHPKQKPKQKKPPSHKTKKGGFSLASENVLYGLPCDIPNKMGGAVCAEPNGLLDQVVGLSSSTVPLASAQRIALGIDYSQVPASTAVRLGAPLPPFDIMPTTYSLNQNAFTPPLNVGSPLMGGGRTHICPICQAIKDKRNRQRKAT